MKKYLSGFLIVALTLSIYLIGLVDNKRASAEVASFGGIKMMPSIIYSVNDLSSLPSEDTDNAPDVLLVAIDSSLNILDSDLEVIGTVAQFLAAIDDSFIPAFSVSSAVQANALYRIIKPLPKGIVISDSKAALAEIPLSGNNIQTATYFDGENADEIVSTANKNNCRIAVIPNGRLTQSLVQSLQQHFITVWAGETAKESDIINAFASGAQGIITGNYNSCYDTLKKLPRDISNLNTYLAGHRGWNGAPENTVEAIKAAYMFGADAVEYDIKLSKDGEIFLFHDGVLDTVTNGTGNVEDKTIAELKAVEYDLWKDYPNVKISTLDEVFEYTKDLDLTHFIEIKTGKQAIVPILKEKINQFNIKNKINIISFDKDMLANVKFEMSDVSIQLLVDDENLSTVSGVLGYTKSLNAAISVPYYRLTKPLADAARKQGIFFAVYTPETELDILESVEKGAMWITTGNPDLAAHCVKNVNAESSQTAEKGVGISVSGEVIRRNGTVRKMFDENLILIEGADKVEIQNGKLIAKDEGKVLVVVKYGVYDGYGTNFISQIVEIQIVKGKSKALLIIGLCLAAVLTVGISAAAYLIVKKNIKKKNAI